MNKYAVLYLEPTSIITLSFLVRGKTKTKKKCVRKRLCMLLLCKTEVKSLN